MKRLVIPLIVTAYRAVRALGQKRCAWLTCAEVECGLERGMLEAPHPCEVATYFEVGGAREQKGRVEE